MPPSWSTRPERHGYPSSATAAAQPSTRRASPTRSTGLRSVPTLDLSICLQDLPNPSAHKTSSSISLSKPFDGSFKPHAYRKHLVLPDQLKPTIPATLSDRCTEAVQERVCRLKLHGETMKRHPKAFNRVRSSDSCASYAEARDYAKNMFKDVHVLRDERDPHRPVPGYTYSRVDPSVAEGKRPSSYDFDDAQTRPRTAGFSPGHIRSLCTWPQLGCVQPQHIVDSLACTVSRASSPTSLAAAERLLLQQQPRPHTAPERSSSPSLGGVSTRFDTATLRRAYAKSHANLIQTRKWTRACGTEMRRERERQSMMLQETMKSLHDFERAHLQSINRRQAFKVVHAS